MRQFLFKLAVSAALASGTAAAAQADCTSRTTNADTQATFQLAQSGSTTSGTGAGTTYVPPRPKTGAGGGSVATPVIPLNEQMRQPSVPRKPLQPGTSSQTR